MTGRIDLSEKFAQLAAPWVPKIVGELNGQHVKVAKFEGPYHWHHHEAEDELFLVVSGRMRLELRDRTIELGPGQFAIVPRGVEHRPVADEECHVVLFEPATTRNTGNVVNDRTIEPEDLERL